MFEPSGRRAGFSLFQLSIKYLCTVIDGDGLRPEMEKIRALVSMPAPANKQQLHSFLGAVEFYLKFINSMSNNAVGSADEEGL